MKRAVPRVVVVTGASAGVGRAAVREFAREGAHIGLLARGKEGLENARHEVERLGGKAVITPADVADPEQVERAAQAVEDAFGTIDVWVNNAMVSMMSPFKEMTPEEFRRITEVTFLGYVWGTRSALKRMLPRDKGHIIQVGSALAYRSIPLQSAYCAAKHAVLGFTESLRSELLHDNSNVVVTMVQMPALNTPQFQWVRNRMPRKSKPIGTIFQPEVAARAILWASRHTRRETYVGFSTVKAIVGDKVAPAMLDRYLANIVYNGHQSDVPEDPGRPDNLFSPLQGDFGAHGPYDEESHTWSPQLWATTHTGLLMLAGAALAGAAFGASLGKARAGLFRA